MVWSSYSIGGKVEEKDGQFLRKLLEQSILSELSLFETKSMISLTRKWVIMLRMAFVL